MDFIKGLVEFFQSGDVLRVLLFILSTIVVLLLNNDRIRRLHRREESRAKLDLQAKEELAATTFQAQMLALLANLIEINSKFGAIVEGNTRAINEGLAKHSEKLDTLNKTNEQQLASMNSIGVESGKSADRIQTLNEQFVGFNNDFIHTWPDVVKTYNEGIKQVLLEGRVFYRETVEGETNVLLLSAEKRHKETRDFVEQQIKAAKDLLIDTLPDEVAAGMKPEFAAIFARLDALREAVLRIATVQNVNEPQMEPIPPHN